MVDTNSHLSDKSIFCKVCSQALPWMAKTAAFHGRLFISGLAAGIDCSHKMLIYVFTELGTEGVVRGKRCYFPLIFKIFAIKFSYTKHLDARF